MQPLARYALLLILLTACGQGPSTNYVPKPKGYPRLDLPRPKYGLLKPSYPYQFEYNQLATILPDTFARSEPYWIFIYYPRYQASIQLTYKPVQGNITRLRAMVDDAYKLATRHQVKAASMIESRVRLRTGSEAMLIDLSGEVASQVQFTTTDSSQHFLRGALYFNTATQNDSLQPIISYIRQDIVHLLNTLRWRN